MDPLLPSDAATTAKEHASGAAKGLGFFGSLAVFNQVFPQTTDRLGAKTLIELGTSTHRKPVGFVPTISPAAVLYLAPAPLGVLPPEFFGLPPDYLARPFPGITPKSDLIATDATLSRLRTFEAAKLLGEIVQEHRERRPGDDPLAEGTGRRLIGKISYSAERARKSNVEGLERDLAFLKALPDEGLSQLSRPAGLHFNVTKEKLTPLIEEIEDIIAERRKNDVPLPAGAQRIEPGNPIPQGGGVLKINGQEYFFPQPDRSPFTILDVKPLIPPAPPAPLPPETLPPYPFQQEAAKTANEVVRALVSEVFDP